ncbi:MULTISPECIES: helix-turn-helix domain-containing protein [Nocardia]|jgi:transcriptional regulator GlxA family with amidase domain|uniref:hypothetical protein n=1 Tax=Nocardia abscessus TaxID=120957 RepID=UPI001E54938D|nr:hypothetical protein [Nocardia abscessus]
MLELNQALEHIECHLDQAVDVEEVARIAATSEYHLRRMFSALAGMPLYHTRTGPEILRTRLSPEKTEVDAELWLPVEAEHG